MSTAWSLSSAARASRQLVLRVGSIAFNKDESRSTPNAATSIRNGHGSLEKLNHHLSNNASGGTMRVGALTTVVPVMLAMCGFSLGCIDPVQPAGAAAAVYTPHSVPATPQPARPVWTACAPGTERLYGEAVPVYQVLYNYHGGLLVSHYTLCDNGTFELAFESGRFPPFDYIGKYSQSDSDVAFNFVDSGAWTATARLRGDTMIVEYNFVMMMADFVNGPYLRQGVP